MIFKFATTYNSNKEVVSVYKEVFKVRIKGIRDELGLSQVKVSAETGIHQSYISKYENGTLEPNLEQLGQLANYYEVSIDWLLGNPHHHKTGKE